MTAPAILTVHDVVALLKVDEKTVYRLARGKYLPGFEVAGSWRFKNPDIDLWIGQQKEATGHPKGNRKRARQS